MSNLSDIIVSKNEFIKLSELIKNDKCIALIGAGFSSNIYPTWRELIDKLIINSSFDINNLPEEVKKDSLQIAQIIKDSHSESYYKTLKEEFIIKKYDFRHELLRNIPFKTILTLNYDFLLEKAFEVDTKKKINYFAYPHLPVYTLGNNYNQEYYIYHLHGVIDEIPYDNNFDIVLTEKEYKKAYEGTLLPSFLYQVFSFFNICIIGCSVHTDPYIVKILEFCHQVKNELKNISLFNPPNCYFLLDNEEYKDNFKNINDLNIMPVLFNKINSKYEGLIKILEYWADYHKAKRIMPFEDREELKPNQFNSSISPDLYPNKEIRNEK